MVMTPIIPDTWTPSHCQQWLAGKGVQVTQAEARDYVSHLAENYLEHTSCWGDGYDTYQLGLPEESCPYPDNSHSRNEWLAGFDAAGMST